MQRKCVSFLSLPRTTYERTIVNGPSRGMCGNKAGGGPCTHNAAATFSGRSRRRKEFTTVAVTSVNGRRGFELSQLKNHRQWSLPLSGFKWRAVFSYKCRKFVCSDAGRFVGGVERGAENGSRPETEHADLEKRRLFKCYSSFMRTRTYGEIVKITKLRWLLTSNRSLRRLKTDLWSFHWLSDGEMHEIFRLVLTITLFVIGIYKYAPNMFTEFWVADFPICKEFS